MHGPINNSNLQDIVHVNFEFLRGLIRVKGTQPGNILIIYVLKVGALKLTNGENLQESLPKRPEGSCSPVVSWKPPEKSMIWKVLTPHRATSQAHVCWDQSSRLDPLSSFHGGDNTRLPDRWQGTLRKLTHAVSTAESSWTGWQLRHQESNEENSHWFPCVRWRSKAIRGKHSRLQWWETSHCLSPLRYSGASIQISSSSKAERLNMIWPAKV